MAMKAHEVVDRALAGRALVLGSLPPAGRDLDVLVRPADVAPVEDALRRAGFTRHAGSWLRFANLTAEIVELIPAASLGLAPAAEARLFADALDLEGCERLARPSPPDALLLLSRKAAAEPPTATRMRRLEATLAEDPQAREKAVARAGGWGGPTMLEALGPWSAQPAGDRHRGSGPLPEGLRVRAGAARDRAAGRQRGAVIALSGLDGSGKSTQAGALAGALERLGYDVAVEWTRLGVEGRAARLAAASERSRTARPALGKHVRATALVLEHSWRQWRRISGFLARDYVVVCDRYTLDSIVSLRCLIDSRCRFALQRRLLRTLTRRPAAAYLLEVPPKTAWRRKGEQSLESLKCHHALYREEREALGVVRLDGERPADDLAAQIAREAYAALRARRRRGVNMFRASCRGR